MNISQIGNGLIQRSEPWKYMREEDSLRNLNFIYIGLLLENMSRFTITLRPFLPFQSINPWSMLGEERNIDDILFEDSFNFDNDWNNEKPNLYSKD